MDNIYRLFKAYKGKKGYIGKTESGREIPYFFLGGVDAEKDKNKPKVIIQCAVHAREHITAELAEYFIKKYGGKKLNVGIYIIPAVNIDGILLCKRGLCSVKNQSKREFLLKINGGSEDFSLFKANINGVDLNTNFSSGFGTGEKNIHYASSENFIGKYPFSESETRALRDFTLKVKPALTISYHCKGEEIYFDFNQSKENYLRDKKIAERISCITGYKIVENLKSGGGYKDWCADVLKIPSLTIEVGDDNLPHPLLSPVLPDIIRRNDGVIEEIERILLK